jgi:glycine/D-amino acid oxidase-like deaminating enzyme/nitrite reductase/ring-hydroxylating ferredoxin subunit
MTSLWLAHEPDIETDTPDPDRGLDGARYDEVIVGAGLTGLVTALLFARAGRRVAVLESRRVGAGATGNTTGKVSLLQGSHLSTIRRFSPPNVLRAYADANREGQAWLLRYCADHGIPVQTKDAVSYATGEKGVATIDREYEAARAVGLPVSRGTDAGLPFRTTATVRLEGQAQIDTMDVLATLVADLRAHGGAVFEDTRVTGVRTLPHAVVHTHRGDVRADHVILATGIPILDRGLYFAKMSANRSYAMAYATTSPLPDGMFLSVDEPGRSIRTAPSPEGELLLTGGNGHPVGRAPSPKALVDDLDNWSKRWWPGSERRYAWSAQDYRTPQRVPFVGWMPRSSGRVYLATGYDKWGMTNAVQAALTLASDVLGGHLPWATTLHHRLTLPQAIGWAIGENASVGWQYAKGWTAALTRTAAVAPDDGQGRVGRSGIRPTAVSTVDGVTCAVSGICPHLGAVVAWNDAERSWDCPAHGSRFSADGTLIDGPATRDLARR